MAGITSTTSIPQANIFGRIGTGLGQGLAEQLPKEFERSRLGNALDQLGQQTNNSPWQNYTGLVKAAHEYPQIVQSGENLLRRQGIARGFERQGQGMGPQPAVAPPGYSGAPGMGQTPANVAPGVGAGRSGPAPSRAESGHVAAQNVTSTAPGEPQITPENPTAAKFQPKNRWTPEQWDQRYAENLNQHPHMSAEQAANYTDQQEAKELSQPEGEKAKLESLRKVEDRLKEKFRERLGLKLHKKIDPKTGIDETLEEVSGTAQNNLIRGMARDLIDHPEKSEEEVINDWSDKGLHLAKAKKQLAARGARAHADLNILFKKDEYRGDIEQDAKAYKAAGNSPELYQDLQTMYNFSPIGSAYLAYDRSPGVKEYIKNWDPKYLPKGVKFAAADIWRSQKVAMDLENIIKDEDSILAIAKSLQYKYPDFNKDAFISHFKENSDRLGLTPDQKLQLSQGTQLGPNWSDFLVLPWTGGKP